MHKLGKLVVDGRANQLDLRETDEFKEYGFQVVNCPVCGRETLDSYWVCDYCGWEYDGTLDENSYSSLNKTTIRKYTYKKNKQK